MRAAFVHVQEGDTWRVFDALVERVYGSVLFGKERQRARLAYYDDQYRLCFIDTEEYESRCSAVYYVLAADFSKLADDIDRDWDLRHLWREAKADVDAIRAQNLEAEKKR